MSVYKNELLAMILDAKKFLEKNDFKKYYFECGKIAKMCHFMVTLQTERNIRSMAILSEVGSALHPFSVNPPNVETFQKALDLVNTI